MQNAASRNSRVDCFYPRVQAMEKQRHRLVALVLWKESVQYIYWVPSFTNTSTVGIGKDDFNVRVCFCLTKFRVWSARVLSIIYPSKVSMLRTAASRFFFVQFDNPQSLKAETILRSILRQSLDIQSLSEEMTTALRTLDNKLYPSLDDQLSLLQQRIPQ